MMNSDFLRDRVRALAGSVAGQGGDASARVTEVYRRLLSRRPSERELALGQAFLQGESLPADSQVATTAATGPTGGAGPNGATGPSGPIAPSGQEFTPWERYVQVILLSNEFDYVD